MSRVQPTVEVFFDLSATGGDFFTLDDPVKGELDSASYPLAGDIATDISAAVYGYSINRGRSRELDEFQAGTATVYLRNYTGDFTPLGFYDPYLRDGNGEILTSGGEPLFAVEPTYGVGNITVGKRVRISAHEHVIFDGTIDDWEYVYNADGSVDARFVAVDALADLAAMEFDAWTSTAGQTAGQRIADALDRSDVDYGSNRDLDDGVSTLQGDSITWGSNVLNYLQLVAKSDLGRLFASRQNVLTFRDRHSLVQPTIMAAFADDGSGDVSGFQRIEPAFGSELLYNKVGVDREGGTLQTANNTASQAKYRIRTLSLSGLLLDSDEQAADMAEYLVNLYGEPQAWIASIGVDIDPLPFEERAVVLMLDIGDPVTVKWTPTGLTGWDDPQSYVVEGVRIDHMVDGLMSVSLSLSPLTGAFTFILDSPVEGVLDSGVLAF